MVLLWNNFSKNWLQMANSYSKYILCFDSLAPFLSRKILNCHRIPQKSNEKLILVTDYWIRLVNAVFIVNFEWILHIVLFPSLTLNN